MSERVPADQIESIVGARRHKREHIVRGVLDEDRVYILHSEECRERYADLRDCPWSRALDQGVAWLPPDEPVIVRVRNGELVVHGPVPPNYLIGDRDD